MDAEALASATRSKAEFNRTEELSRALRSTRSNPLDDRPGREDLFLVASETEEFLRVVGASDLARRFEAEITTAVDTVLAFHTYRLRLALLRHGVHV